LHFCFGPQVCIGSSCYRSCGVVPWHGSVRNIILQHSITLPPHFTTNFSLHTTGSTHTTFLLHYRHGTETFLLHFQLRPQFCIGRSSWTAWKMSEICPGVVV
jgi:hypothetical protein